MTSNRRAFIALGTNHDTRMPCLEKAMRRLRAVSPRFRCSSLYETAPQGSCAQPPFLNAVAELWWKGSANSLMGVLGAIERHLGRKRLVRWGRRSIDLDLLLLGNQVMHHRSLAIPHPSMVRRPFVLIPLLELAPKVRAPDTGRRYARGRWRFAPGGIRRAVSRHRVRPASGSGV